VAKQLRRISGNIKDVGAIVFGQSYLNKLNSSKKKTIFLAALGCVAIAGYFWLITGSDLGKISDLLRQTVSKQTILEKATQAYQSSELAEFDLPLDIDLKLNDNLFTYAEIHLNNQLPDAFYPIASWDMTWSGKTETKEVDDQPVYYKVKYDLAGNLVRLEQDAPELKRPPNFKEAEALAEAKLFLQNHNVDTSVTQLTNKSTTQDERVLTYDLTFSKPSPVSADLRESYAVRIVGRNIVRYRARVVFDRDQPLTPASHQSAKIISHVVAMAVWTLIAVFLIAGFFKRLRHDEIEFKRAVRVGGGVFLLMFAMIALETWPEWLGVLVGGGLAGLLTGLGAFVVYAATDSFVRDSWPERLALTDVVCRGFVRVQELGKALLNSLFISGTTLLLFAASYWLVSKFALGYLEFEDEMLSILNGTSSFASGLLKNLISAIFIALMLMLFWTASIKKKIRNKVVLLVTLALFLNLSGLHLYYIRPTFMAFVIFVPLAILWAYYMLRFDFVAILIALFTVSSFLEFFFIKQVPGGHLSMPGMFAWLSVSALLATGIYLLLSKRSIQEFKHYTPEYVSRIAERERLHKELEIARTVQKRFLPQSLPTFAGLDLASVCEPAMEIGGDYYDFILTGSNSLGVVIGDVSGKGVSAAFYMTLAKGIIKTLSKKSSTPKRILSEMNIIFYENVPKGVFISVIYGEFDVERRVLTFARAGHNPLIMHKASSGATEFVLPKGLAIGLDGGTIFSETIEEVAIPFEENDVFVFYTDGLSESMNRNGDEFGEDRLQNIICRTTNGSAQDMLNHIREEVGKFTGDVEQHDDLTMVVVKVGSLA